MINSGNDEESEYTFVKATGAHDELKKIANVVYLSPDMTDEDKAEYEGKEANHESVMEYLMNLLPDTVKDEIKQEEIEDEDNSANVEPSEENFDEEDIESEDEEYEND